MRHKDIRWNREIQEWYCAKCGRTSDHANKEDALVELEQYDCELPTSENPAKRREVSRKKTN
jgi:hypothetical protein